MRTQTFADAPLASDKDYSTSPQYSMKNMPVLICSHGLAANRAGLTALCSEFASYGYVVAAVEHRYFVIQY